MDKDWTDELQDPDARTVAEEHAAAVAIAEIMIALRSKLGLTQRDIAAAAGMQQPAIARIESGESSPTWETVYRILRAVDARLELELPKWHRRRSGGIEVESSGYLFRTIPEKPGFLDVFRLADGKREGPGAVVFAGTPIRALAPTKNGVLVTTGRHEARVAKNMKGYWTVYSTRLLEPDEAILERSEAANS